MRIHRPTRRFIATLGAAGLLAAIAMPAAALAAGPGTPAPESGCELLVSHTPTGSTGDAKAVAITSQTLAAGQPGWERVGWKAAKGVDISEVRVVREDGTEKLTKGNLRNGHARHVLELRFCSGSGEEPSALTTPGSTERPGHCEGHNLPGNAKVETKKETVMVDGTAVTVTVDGQTASFTDAEGAPISVTYCLKASTSNTGLHTGTQGTVEHLTNGGQTPTVGYVVLYTVSGPAAGNDSDLCPEGTDLAGQEVPDDDLANCDTDTGAKEPGDPKDPEDPKDLEDPKDPRDPKDPKNPEDPEEPKDPEGPKDDPRDPVDLDLDDPSNPEATVCPAGTDLAGEAAPGGDLANCDDEVLSRNPTDNEEPAEEPDTDGTDTTGRNPVRTAVSGGEGEVEVLGETLERSDRVEEAASTELPRTGAPLALVALAALGTMLAGAGTLTATRKQR